MQTTQQVQNCEWCSITVAYPHSSGGNVQYVYCRRPGRTLYEAWVVVAESALLSRLGKRGRGLYCARAFSRDDLIGQYTGNVVGNWQTREEAIQSRPVQSLVRHGKDCLMAVRAVGGGWDIVDGASAAEPFLQRINDPRGTRYRPNVDVSDWGYVRCVAARIPGFRLDRTLDENCAAELKLRYDDSFWDIFQRLGSAEMPLEVSWYARVGDVRSNQLSESCTAGHE